MTFSGSSYDIQTPSKERIFRSVSFGQVSPYKQILAGSYHFFAAAPSGFSPVRELPIILQSFLTGSLTPSDSLADISVQIEAGKNYTTYLIGNTWSSFRLQTLIILQSFLTGSLTPSDSLADISVQIEAGKNYTTYLIGNTWSSFRLQTLTVEDN